MNQLFDLLDPMCRWKVFRGHFFNRFPNKDAKTEEGQEYLLKQLQNFSERDVVTQENIDLLEQLDLFAF